MTLGSPVGVEEDVGGLEVAVDDPLVVRGLDGVGELGDEVGGGPGLEPAFRA